MNVLVGYTGFVGSNIMEKGEIDQAYNSKNIEESYGKTPELLIYAGLRAEKYLANTMPEKDMELILQAEDNIRKISPKKLVLISTIDIFKLPINVDENSVVDDIELHPYGLNRYRLEQWTREHYPDALIIRLPGLFGSHIKKNFIYDLINPIPMILKADKFEQLSMMDNQLNQFYYYQNNGFYKCRDVQEDEKVFLLHIFNKLHFSSLNFTDSRNIYQFYPLERLWNDIQTALNNKIKLLHLATEPVSAGELYTYLTGNRFCNELLVNPVCYDYRTQYDTLFGGYNGYIYDRDTIKEKIRIFIRETEK